MSQDTTLANALPTAEDAGLTPQPDDSATFTAQGVGAGDTSALAADGVVAGDTSTATTEGAVPPEGSNEAATLDFARNLTRLIAERGLDTNRLAALTVEFGDKTFVEISSIRDYERGKHRPKQPTLWVLAQALDVMPIVLGPSMTREAPLPTELLLRKKGSRSLRLQHLVELLTEDGRVSTFAEMVRLEPATVYAMASSDVRLTDEQLEPFLEALPRVRRYWLMSGEGEALQPVRQESVAGGNAGNVLAAAAASAGAAAGDGEATSGQMTSYSMSAPAFPAQAGNALGIPAMRQEWGAGQVGGLSAVPPVRQESGVAGLGGNALAWAVAPTVGAPLYIQLGGGLVAEVDALMIGGGGSVTSLRLLTGAGGLAALTSHDQLERLFHTMRGVLDQRAGE